jgi:hypothetical protein
MTNGEKAKSDPLQGTKVTSTIATGGGGGVFQSRVGALYLANMLTGLPTAFSLHGCRVEALRFEARYAGAHTDDIFCRVRSTNGTHLQLIQCKRGLNATVSNDDFVDGLQGAWRDFFGLEGSPFDRLCDVLVLATIAPATAANRAAKRLCELSRASVDLADFLLKLKTPKLLDRKHDEVWETFKEVSKSTLTNKYAEELVFQLLRCLRVDIHDLGTESSQEISLVQALLTSGQQGDSGELVWDGLFSYVYEQGIAVGTVTRATWASTAKAGLQEAVSRLSSQRGLGSIAERFSERSRLQFSLISTTLPNGTHIPRGECVARVLGALEERQLTIVTGGPGAGKSAVMAGLAPILRESGPLFFFRADELDRPSLAAVQSLTGVPDPLLTIASLLGGGTPIVVIDSLEKALEARNPGALDELLALVRQNKGAKLCITTRSYALNPLYTNFLASFSSQVVEVPLLSDAEISAAVASSSLEEAIAKDAGVREVLRAPYYLRLAVEFTAGGTELPSVSGNELRRMLWTSRIAPSKGLPAGMATRRQKAFDLVCYQRTERFAQFVMAPDDAEAVDSLLHDAVLAKDAADRVAPAHDVLEDWSLFFRVEREVRSAERDWIALFEKLGSHAGMRRALRTWTAQRSAEGDSDAYALLEATLRQDSEIPRLWRDEVAIGLLRSDQVEDLVARLASSVEFDNANLLKRLCHLLRVACKGPSSIDYSHLADDPANKEIVARIGMAAPVGKAWDVMGELVAKAFPALPPESHSWVVQFCEDAIAHNEGWRRPTQRVRHVFSIAEHYCLFDSETWYREQSIGRRFYALLCSCCGSDVTRFTAFIDVLLKRLAHESDRRDLSAEERLEHLINVKHCKEPSYFTPDTVREVFWALYIGTESRGRRHFRPLGWESDLGLSERAAHKFFPPSVLQGPFRALLLNSYPKSLRFVVDLCNHAADAFAKAQPGEVVVLPPEVSPNGRPHIHDWRLWTAYRGHSVTSYILNCALMALEERLLIEAKSQPETTSQVIEVLLEIGESTFTTGLVAGVLMAHPNLVTEKLLSIFKCPAFFSADIARSVQEPHSLAIYGGHDGLDSERQNERVASNRLPHRRHHLEDLALQLQFNRPDLRDAIFAILDKHVADVAAETEAPEGWRMALKRMDTRGLKFGEPTGDGNLVPLEVADLEPELKQIGDQAYARMQLMNRLAAVRLWAGAITDRTSTFDSSRAESFESPQEPYNEFLQLRPEFQGQDSVMLLGMEDELACALIQRWPTDSSEALQWAKAYLLEVAARQEDKDAWVHRGSTTGELRAGTLILLASVDPQLAKMAEGLANIVTEPVWKVRRAAANAISEVLWPRQPVLADVLTTALSQYAEALDTTIKRPRTRNRDIVDDARAATVKAVLSALSEMKPRARAVPKSLAAVKEWTIALDAARGETPDTWRIQALTAVIRLMADQEGKPRVQHHDPDYVDYEALWETGELLAAELLEQHTDQSPPFELLDYCLEHAPDLSERVLESTLGACMKQEFANAEAFWRVWDRAAAKILPDDSLRTRSRRTFSRFDKVLRTLLFCSIPWPKTWNDLLLLQARPNYIANCLAAAGDSLPALENLLRLMAGVGSAQSVPTCLPQLRDALGRAPAYLFDDGNSLWYAETVCRVAVHEHRETLIRDITLRRAALGILDRLVDAGSSLAFQLRDYLAASPTERAERTA